VGNLFLVPFYLVAKPWQLGSVGGGYGTINDLVDRFAARPADPDRDLAQQRQTEKWPRRRFSPHHAEHPHGMPCWQTQGGVAPAARVTDMAQSSRPPAERSPRPLLAGKLTVPLLQPGIVTRDRLLEVLDENGTRRLCVVVAPAGWGKTTLLAEWARRAGDRHAVAWVTLDETDDEPHRFWTYVVTALRTAAPDLGGGALAALRVPGVDPVDVALPALLNDLSGSNARHTLILDDYHLLADVRIHEAVEYLLSYLPPSLRLVIAARFDPPLPIARMRARSELTEIRAADLRFSAAEAAGLVSAVGEVDVGAYTVDALVDQTEGWAVGLKLAALTIRGSADPAAGAAEVRGDDRHIIDFLSSEVLDRLPADWREFLVRTAVLDQLCGSLCDAVLGRTGSSAVLEALERADLFVVPLDAHRGWYRYHRLFRDVLRRELEATAPGAVPELLRRAADWYLAAGQVDEAVRLLTAAGDRRKAGQLLLSAEDAFLEQGAAATYLRLGDQLGTATVREDPRLAVSMAGAAAQSGQPDRVPALLDIAEAHLGDPSPPYQGWCSLTAAAAMLRAAYDPVVRADPPLMLAYAERARGLETDPTLQGHVIARMTLGVVLSRLDRREEAIPLLSDAWERSAQVDVPVFIRLQAAGLLAMCLFETGREEAARRLVHQVAPAVHGTVQALGDAAAPAVTLLMAVDGRLAYRDGEPDTALRLLTRASELARIAGHPSQTVYVLTALADAALAAGDRPAARAAIDEARETADTGVAFPATARWLAAVEERIGRRAARAARREGQLVEELTDRELSLLRALQGTLSQREIGAELYLSVNTIKGYTKSLYRKLGAASRADAVERGRQLGLI
jgi:LuxR family transcriptional regulator, maltose regulon positive regulatory protein